MPAYGYRIPIKDRFATKFEVDPVTGCWNWTSAIAEGRYGMLWMADGKSEYAHRLSFVLHKGPIPCGMLVLHTCDNTKCVNPDHLYIGTQKQNVADMYARNRQHNQNGVRNPCAKLTDKKVCQIKALINSPLSQEKIARQFGVSRKTISAIWKGWTWTHVR